jgi:hypothetical protein
MVPAETMQLTPVDRVNKFNSLVLIIFIVIFRYFVELAQVIDWQLDNPPSMLSWQKRTQLFVKLVVTLLFL